ncbi:MAG: aldo/keto reductase [Candidatus Woesearchaeota archaeon]
MIAFGTYRLFGEKGEQILKYAIEVGYRIIDTAESYQNEDMVGRVLKMCDRKKIFLITKVSPNKLMYKDLIHAAIESVKKLDTYIDLYLIHIPNPVVPLGHTIQAMKKLQEKSIIRYYGVSNFDYMQTLEAINYGIYAHQHEYSLVYRWFEDVLALCKLKKVKFFAYRPLSYGDVFMEPFKSYIEKVAKKHNRTIAQISLKWIQQKGAIPIIGSQNPDHIKEDFDLNFEIPEEDMEYLDELFKELVVKKDQNKNL